MFELNGLSALVTGATGGLGGAMARALHAQGATVAISGTRREALEALAAELGERVHVLPCDLAEKAEVEALVPAAESAMGQLDILVNNAGVTKDGLFMRMKDDDWDAVLAINLTSAFRLSRAALKGMMKRRFGRIIGITSVVGVTGNPGQGNYAASKAGLYRQPHDRWIERQAEGGDSRHHPCGQAGFGRRYRRRPRLSGEPRGGLCDRPDPACEWRNGHDLIAQMKPRALSPWALKCVTYRRPAGGLAIRLRVSFQGWWAQLKLKRCGDERRKRLVRG